MSISRLRIPLLATLALTACASFESTLDDSFADPAQGSITRDVRYAGDAADGTDPRLGDVYRPAGEGPFPAVLLIHGGSWQTGARWNMASLARRFARSGYVAYNVDYRLAPEHRFPAQLEDVRDAFRWLHAHAETYSIDPNRIAVMGYSAGAHLALMLALSDPGDGPAPNAVVAGAPPTDLTEAPDSPILANLIGGSGRDLPEAYKEASPISHVSPGDPPVMLYHGTLDMRVAVEQSRRLYAQLRAAGVVAELREEPWEGHTTAYFLDGDSFRAALAFLGKRMHSVQ
jgi:acetyl esterase/lipase